MDKVMHLALRKHRDEKMKHLAEDDHGAMSKNIEAENEERNIANQGSDLAPDLKEVDGARNYSKAVPGEEDMLPDKRGLIGEEDSEDGEGMPESALDIKELLGSEGGNSLRSRAVAMHDEKNGRKDSEKDMPVPTARRKGRADKQIFASNKYE